MKLCRLKSYDTVPPNCYQFPGFDKSPVIEALAKSLSARRAGNGLPRSDFRSSLEDVDGYNAIVVLGCNPNWTWQTDKPGVSLGDNSPLLAPCKGCGAPV